MILTKKKQQELMSEGYDLDFVVRTQPKGGFGFKERNVSLGDCFLGFLHVYMYADDVDDIWLSDFTKIEETITVIDTATANKEQVIRDIDKSLVELKDQESREHKVSSQDEASSGYDRLREFSHSLKSKGEVIKITHVRIGFYDGSEVRLEERMEEVKKDIENKGHKLVILQFRSKQEWLSMFHHHDKQVKFGGLIADSKKVLPSTNIGAGLPFHHQSLQDPRGMYLGKTRTGGMFTFDPFQKTKRRPFYSGFLLGQSGYGKSTMVKQLITGLLAKDTYIRGFDIAPDMFRLVEDYGGMVIDLSGGKHIINPLQIFATVTDDDTLEVLEQDSLNQHFNKLEIMMKQLNPDFSQMQLLEINKEFREFYIDYGLLPENYNPDGTNQSLKVTGLNAKEYPTFSEFEKYLISTEKRKRRSHEENLRFRELKLLVGETIARYGHMFNGHTTVDNLEDEQLIYFDIRGISRAPQNIFSCQMFLAFSSVQAHAIKHGQVARNGLKSKSIRLEDVKHTAVIIEECHNVINYRQLEIVRYVTNWQREMRKYRSGIWLITQSPREVLPKNTNSESVDELEKVFALTQYKVFFMNPSGEVEGIKKALGNTITETEYARLPDLSVGEAIFQVSNQATFEVRFDPDEMQLDRFDGG